MAASDVFLQRAMMTYFVPALALVAFIYWLWNNGSEWKKRVFARFLAKGKMMREFHACTYEIRQDIMKRLDEVVSQDIELRNKGVIRILEVGVGAGANLSFYPKNCHLVAVEPNQHFLPYLTETLSKWPHVHLERFVAAKAEDMSVIDDGTVDVVVETSVLCSVDNVEKSLKEIKRVLAKGGKFYFLDHVIAPEGSWINFFQNAIRIFWSFLFDCELTRDIKRSVEIAGFSNVDVKNIIFESNTGAMQLVKHHVVGVATK